MTFVPSSPTTGHVHIALLNSVSTPLTEQLAEAARAAGVVNNQVLCNPIRIALIISSNHSGLPCSSNFSDLESRPNNNNSDMKDRINQI